MMFDASQFFLLMLVVEIENDLNLKMKNKEHTFFNEIYLQWQEQETRPLRGSFLFLSDRKETCHVQRAEHNLLDG